MQPEIRPTSFHCLLKSKLCRCGSTDDNVKSLENLLEKPSRLAANIYPWLCVEFMNRMFSMQNMQLLYILPSSPLNKGGKITMKHSGNKKHAFKC